MSDLDKYVCDHCKKEERYDLNHSFTVVRKPDGEVLVRHGVEPHPKPNEKQLCSSDCLAREIARWAEENDGKHPAA